MALMGHHTGAYPSLCSIKRLEYCILVKGALFKVARQATNGGVG